MNDLIKLGTKVKLGNEYWEVAAVLNGASFGERTYLLTAEDGAVTHYPAGVLEHMAKEEEG